MKVKLLRHAYYGPKGNWDYKDEVIATLDIEFESLDSRTFIEESPEVLEYWKMCGASLLESLDEFSPVDDENMSAYVEYRVFSSKDNLLIRTWLAQ